MHAGIRHEIAPVTRFHDEFISDPQHSDTTDVLRPPVKEQDPESIVEAPASSRSSSEATCRTAEGHESRARLVPAATPFFHFDLTSAVRAAETTVARHGRESYGTFDDDTKVTVTVA